MTFTFDLLTFNSWRTWRVTWPTVPPSLKTLRLFVHELRVITVPVGYHWKCLRGHWACAESRDPCVPGRTANTMTYCPTWHAVERATGIIINKSGKFEDIVLMIAKRQAYRHSDGDIIQACYRIVFLTTSVLEAINVKKLTSLKLRVRTTWWTQSTKTAKIFWVTLDGAMQGGVLTSWL